MKPENTLIARIRTDDRDNDLEDQRELLICPFEKGWLVDVVAVGADFKNPVELYLHGDKARNIMLSEFIGDAYYSIMQVNHPESFPKRESLTHIMEEVSQWRMSHNGEGKIKLPHSNSEDFAVSMSDNDSLPLSQRKNIHICFGGNGDWYVKAMSEDEGDWSGVRLATSGGVSWRYPNLCVSIAQAFRVIHCPYQEKDVVRYDDLSKELKEWRNKHPNKEFDGIFIADKKN